MSRELHADKEHEKFREMCAVAAARGLTASEGKELESHLEKCGGCREMLSQYRALGTLGLAALAAGCSEQLHSQSWDGLASWEQLLARIGEDQAQDPALEPAEAASVSRPSWLQRIRAHWFERLKRKAPSASSK